MPMNGKGKEAGAVTGRLLGLRSRVFGWLYEAVSLAFALPLLPLLSWRTSLYNVQQQALLSRMRCQAHTTREELRLRSHVPVDLLRLYLWRLNELEQRYATTNFVSMEDAELGYRLLVEARAALHAEALASLRSLDVLVSVPPQAGKEDVHTTGEPPQPVAASS